MTDASLGQVSDHLPHGAAAIVHGAFAVEHQQIILGDETLQLLEIDERRRNLGDEVNQFTINRVHDVSP